MILSNFFNLRNLPGWKIFAGKILVVRLPFQRQSKYKLWPGNKLFISLWSVLRKIRAVWGRVSVAAAWWLIIKNIVNYVIKHDLNYFGHERGMIKETKKVWHLPVSLYLWQLYKIMFFRFFWMRLADFFR